MSDRYAIVDANGHVVNVIEYPAGAPGNPPPGFPPGFTAVQSDTAGPGWTVVNGTLTAPTPAPGQTVPPPAPSLHLDDLAALLVSKGVLQAADVNAAKK